MIIKSNPAKAKIQILTKKKHLELRDKLIKVVEELSNPNNSSQQFWKLLGRYKKLRKLINDNDYYKRLKGLVRTEQGGICYEEGCYKPIVHIHHIARVIDRPDKVFTRSNLIGLCLKHHETKH